MIACGAHPKDREAARARALALRVLATLNTPSHRSRFASRPPKRWTQIAMHRLAHSCSALHCVQPAHATCRAGREAEDTAVAAPINITIIPLIKIPCILIIARIRIYIYIQYIIKG